jgi:glycerol-3-phosphate O-acyltransferase
VLLAKVLQKIFTRICVHQGEIELLQRAHATALPIIYIPVFRSFMDPLILRWTLIHAGLPIPYFITSGQR